LFGFIDRVFTHTRKQWRFLVLSAAIAKTCVGSETAARNEQKIVITTMTTIMTAMPKEKAKKEVPQREQAKKAP
jgi:hypothetical protein